MKDVQQRAEIPLGKWINRAGAAQAFRAALQRAERGDWIIYHTGPTGLPPSEVVDVARELQAQGRVACVQQRLDIPRTRQEPDGRTTQMGDARFRYIAAVLDGVQADA